MSKAQSDASKDPGMFATFVIFYFRSAVESQGFSWEGMFKHFLE